MQASSEPKVDLIFRLMGQTLPVDHGYPLFSAVSRLLPEFHADQAAGMGLVRGHFVGNGLLRISARTSLTLRIPISCIPLYLGLAGKGLDLMGHKLQVGVPNTRALIPATTLYAHLVTTKNGNDQGRFQEEVSRQLAALGISGNPALGRRRTFQVHGKQVVGYSLLVSELTAEESIILQEEGLGGRRKMGCGFFEEWRAPR